MKKIFQIELEVPEGFEDIEPQVSQSFLLEDTVVWSLVSRLPTEAKWVAADETHVGKQVRARDYEYEEWATGKLVHVEDAEYRYLVVVPGSELPKQMVFESVAEWFKICEVEE